MNIVLLGVLAFTLMLVTVKRISALINIFMFQSLLIFIMTLYTALNVRNNELFIVAFLILVIKVILIPFFLHRLVKNISIDENLGNVINPMLSLFITIFLIYSSYLFAGHILAVSEKFKIIPFTIAISIIAVGFFIMLFRLKAIAQIIGLLVIENGLFLMVAVLCEGMPFFVELAIFFDVFMVVIILGVFVYRINRLFTNIDVNMLKTLKG